MHDVAATRRRAGSSRTVAKSEDHRQDYQSANRPRNRSESTADLFDNSKAPRQHRGKGEGAIEEAANGNARRVTSHDTSAVNAPLGEPGSPRRHGKHEEQRGNDTLERFARPPKDPQNFTCWLGNASRVEASSPILKSAFLDSIQTREKTVEAYIDAVYKQAVREKATSEKREEDKRNGNLLDERDRTGDSPDRSADSSRRTVDRRIDDGRSLIRGESIMSEPRSESERKNAPGINEEDRR